MFRESWNNHAISDPLESVVCLEEGMFGKMFTISYPRIIQFNQLVFRGYLWFQEFEGYFDTYSEWMKSKSFSIDSLLHKSATSAKMFGGPHTFPNTLPVQTPHVSSLCSLEFPPSQKNVQVAQHVRLTDKDVPIQGWTKKVPGFVKWSPVWETFCQGKKAALTCDLFSEFNKSAYMAINGVVGPPYKWLKINVFHWN